tara:strand:- start:383 stop:607 length:225 start_codon:yes stop_codon:yes gene_type:complete
MIGVIEEVQNKNKTEEAEKSSYYRIVVYSSKREKYLNMLLTASDLNRVLTRAGKNEEDCVKPNLFQRFLHWFIR